MGSPLDNQLLRENQLAANQFTGETYQDVLNWFDERGRSTESSTNEFRYHHIEQALEGLEQDANGHYYNGDGERVYVYRDSAELGDDSGGYASENIVMRTEQEIRDAWNADQGMGYFQKANPHLSADDYMGFVGALDELYASGQMTLNPHDELYHHREIGRGPNSHAINEILLDEAARVKEYNKQLVSSVMGEYGIQDSFVNDDGDVFKFNGSNYTKTHKVDDHMGVGDYVKIGAGVLMSVYAGPMIASSLGSFMGPAMAKAASSAIISQATSLMNGQGLSLGDALQSAAFSYGGAKLGDMFSSGGELSGTVSEITDKVTSATDKFNELITTGNSIADAAIKAGGMSMLTSLVMNGEVDIESAGLAALMAGGAEGLGKLGTSLTEAGATPEETDQYMADLAESEEFQQAAIDADIKDPFLNPNYTTVGDGLMTNSAGEIFNYAGDIMGTMDDLDLDGDGLLNGNDLQNITTPDRPLKDPNITPEADDLSYGGTHPVTEIAYDENGNPYVQRKDVFWKEGDDQNLYFEDGTVAATNNGEGTWTFGEGDNAAVGKLSEFGFEADSGPIDFELQADKARLPSTEMVIYDPESDTFKSTGTRGDQGMPMPTGEQDHGYWLVRDEDGTVYVTDGYKMEKYRGGIDDDPIRNDGLENRFRNKDPIWQHVNNGGVLPDGTPVREHFPDIVIDETTPKPPTPEEVEQEPVEEVDNNSSANGDPNNSANAGQGTGGDDSASTGGQGAEGVTGGSGTVGGGALPPVGINTGGPGSQASGGPAGGNVGNVPSPDSVDPSDGTGTPVTPPMNAQIEALMARGMTYEQAVANQKAAIKAGADANNDGMVTNHEWAEHTGNVGTGGSTAGTNAGAGTGGTGGGASTGGGTGTGAGAGAGTGTGGSGSGAGGSTGTGAGTGTGTGAGTGSGSGTNGTSGGGSGGTVGGGEGVDPGVGTGTEPGAGGGAGGGGNGPGGNGMMGMAGAGGSVPFEKFSKLDPYVWQKFYKRRNPLINTAPPTPTQNRQSLLSGLWNEAMK